MDARIPHARPQRGSLLNLLATALAVLALSWLAMALTRTANGVASIWFSNGLVVALLLRTRREDWPQFLVAAYVGTVAAVLLAHEPFTLSLAVGVVNSLECLAAAWLTGELFEGPAEPWRWRTLRIFLGGTVLAPTLGAAAFGALLLHEVLGLGWWAGFSGWWPATALGMLVMVPLGMSVPWQPTVWRDLHWSRGVPFLASWGVLAMTTLAVFGQTRYPVLFLNIFPLLLMAYLHGALGAAVGMFTVAVLSSAFTVEGLGPMMLMPTHSQVERVAVLQLSLALAFLLTYGMGVLIAQRRRLEETLRRSQAQFQTLTEALPAMILHVDAEERYRFCGGSMQPFGPAPHADVIGRTIREVRGEAHYRYLEPRIRAVMRGERQSFDTPFEHEGEMLYFRTTMVPQSDAAGVVVGFYGLVVDVTEARRSQAALAQSEQRLRSVSDNIPALVTYVGADERYRFVNAYGLEMLGKRLEDLVGHTVAEAHGERLSRMFMPDVRRALAGERVCVEKIVDTDGEPLTYQMTLVPDVDAGGTVLGLYGMTVDISQTRRSAVQLARSEKRLRAIADNMPVVIMHLDREERYLYVSAAAEKMFGTPAAQMLGRTVREVRGAAHYRTIEAQLAEARAGRTVTFEGSINVRGRLAYMQATYAPEFDDAGNVTGLFAMVNDVTEARVAQQALARSEGRLRAIADHIPALITHLDTQERYQFVNAFSSEAFGIPAERMLGKTVREIRGEEAYNGIAPYLRQALHGHKISYEGVLEVNGRSMHYRASLVPEFDAQGRVIGFFALTTDISEARRATAMLTASEARLRAITDNLPVQIAYFDHDARFRFVNQHLVKDFRMPMRKIVGRTIAEVRGPSMARAFAREVQEALEGRQITFEKSFATSDRILHYQSTFIPDVSPEGDVNGFYALTMDVTEARVAEKALAQSERRLRDITDNLPLLVSYIDREERYQFTNAYYRTVFGLDPKDMINQTFLQVWGGEWRNQIEPHLHAVMGGTKVRFEREVDQGGRHFHHLVDFLPDRDEYGEVRGFYASVLDITERKDAELRQAESERRLQVVTDNIPGLVMSLDGSGHVNFCNAAFRSWFGLTPERLLQMRFDQALPPELAEPQREAIGQAYLGLPGELDFEITLRGRPRSLHSVIVPEYASASEVVGVHILTSDVSALKEVQKQLVILAQYDHLTGLVNRREIENRIQEALNRSRRDDSHVALLFLDVDHFKALNDTLGHAAGDVVLQEIALRLRANARESDLVGRLAGDEFVMVLEGVRSPDEAQFVARKIIAAMNAPILLPGGPRKIGLTIGITLDWGKVESRSEMLANADKALYSAKQAGRGTSRVFRQTGVTS